MDNGAWKDEGEWSFDYNTFYAILSADMSLVLDGELPTASGNEMKSGYGLISALNQLSTGMHLVLT